MKNVTYINASAGTGKTYKLTHILPCEMAQNNIEPSQVVVSTFTVAAANEIKQKAREVLISKELYDQATNLESAAIGTIHSVCERFVKMYWYALGISPELKVVADSDVDQYMNESLAKCVSEEDFRFFRNFTMDFGLNSNALFWLDDIKGLAKKIRNTASDDVKRMLQNSLAAIDLYFSGKAADDPKAVYDALKSKALSGYVDKIANAKKEVKLDKEARDAIAKLGDYSLAAVKGLWAAETKRQGDSKKQTSVLDEQERLALSEILTSEEVGNRIKELVEKVFKVASAWVAEYNEYKKKNELIDYDDMEAFFHTLLTDEKFADIQKEIASQYKLILVDEFQDCSPIQLRIFQRLSDLIAEQGGKSYWVGDPKQAIYGFRGADAQNVENALKEFEKPESQQNGLKTETLETNYRTRKPLVDLVVKYFKKAGLPHVVGAKRADEESNGKLGDPYLHWHARIEKYSSLKKCAAAIAEKIKSIVEQKEEMTVFDKETGAYRPADYQDFAILARSHSNVNDIADVLRQRGIPVSAPEKSITERIEVQLLLHLLHFSFAPSNAYDKAVILHLLRDSTEDVLVDRLRFERDYEANKVEGEHKVDYWKDGDDIIQQAKLVAEQVKGLNVAERISHIILAFNLHHRVARWGEESARTQNLSVVYNMAKAFVEHCQTSGKPGDACSPIAFSKYIAENDAKDPKVLGTKTVKVYTYHASKGLEWPIVILASLDNAQDKHVSLFGINDCADGSFRYVPDCGLGLDKEGNGVQSEQDFLEHIRNVNRQEAAHLLYVGMTRARDYMITLSHGKDADLKWVNALTNVTCKVEKPNEGLVDVLQIAGQDSDADVLATLAVLDEVSDAGEVDTPKYSPLDLPTLCDNHYASHTISPSMARSQMVKVEAELTEAHNGLPVFSVTQSQMETQDGDTEDSEADPEQSSRSNSKIGNCVHDIFAACNPGDADIEAVVESVSKGYDVSFDNAKVASAIKEFFNYMAQTYGPDAQPDHEVPFRLVLGDRVAVGEIDLVWHKTPKDVVLVDYKFVGDKHCTAEHLAKAYKEQQSLYKQALTQAGYNVVDAILYCPQQGKIFKFAF